VWSSILDDSVAGEISRLISRERRHYIHSPRTPRRQQGGGLDAGRSLRRRGLVKTPSAMIMMSIGAVTATLRGECSPNILPNETSTSAMTATPGECSPNILPETSTSAMAARHVEVNDGSRWRLAPLTSPRRRNERPASKPPAYWRLGVLGGKSPEGYVRADNVRADVLDPLDGVDDT
jgi:hypothetical protein